MRAHAHSPAPIYACGVRAPTTKPLAISQAQRDAWFALVFVHAALTSQVDAILMERHGITFSGFEIFCRLRETEPQPVRALAGELVSVSPTRASRIIQEHIDKGHLQRGADQGDGRVSLISFTASGQRYADAVERSFEEALGKYFVDVLDADDIDALLRIWAKLRDAG
jgi:DNA-binding MarR family transcriptional regulator